MGSRYKVLYKLDLGKFNKLHPMPVVLPRDIRAMHFRGDFPMMEPRISSSRASKALGIVHDDDRQAGPLAIFFRPPRMWGFELWASLFSDHGISVF